MWLPVLATSCLFFALVTLQSANVVDAGRSAIEPVSNGGSRWSKSTADREVENDIKAFLKAYDNQKHKLREIADEFKRTQVKDTGIRKLGVWGMNFGRIYDLPAADKAEVYKRMKENAEMLMDSFETTHSYVEDTEMTGWPMYVAPKDTKPSFEAFNSGHMAAAVCNAARAAAENGDEALAGKWVSQLMDYFYDNYLTDDIEKTKLDSDGWVVYVPKEASSGRAERHKKVTEQKYCLDVPQAYNHGILAARAGMALDRTIDAIDWKKVEWNSGRSKWGRLMAQRKLKQFIMKSGDLLLGDMDNTSGSYPGGKGDIYQWQYRDVSKCNEDRGTFKDRYEDIAHGPYEINFFSEWFEWGGRVSVTEMHTFARTFLSMIVNDYGAKGGDRFSCDVAGTNDGTKRGSPYWPEKNCGNSRELWKRVTHAPLWLSSAYSLRDNMSDNGVKCDVYLMMKAVLPMMDNNSKDFDEHFEEMDSHWGSHAIQAKYYFYNYDAAFERECGNVARAIQGR